MNTNDIQAQKERELLKQEVLDELKKQTLKKELVDEIQKRSKAASLSSFGRHPATLLIIGFLLTGIVGTLLTTRWQRKEWDRQQTLQNIEWNKQQSRLVQIHNIDHKYEVISEITMAVGQSNAAASEILFTFNPKANDLLRAEGSDERIKLWQQAQHNWQIAVSVIRQKLSVFFRNEQLQDHLLKIADRIDLIFFNLLELIDRATENQKEMEEEGFKRIAINTKLLINSRSEDLQQLVSLMIEEIQADAK